MDLLALLALLDLLDFLERWGKGDLRETRDWSAPEEIQDLPDHPDLLALQPP